MKKKTSVLYSAVALSAVIAYCGFLLKGRITETNQTEETVPYEEESIIIIDSSAEIPSEESGKSEESEKSAESEIPAPAVKTDAPHEEPSEILSEKGFSPIYPVSGEVVTPFSESLTYNSITGDWRSHPGIDIKAAKTARVLACEDGTVARCFEDSLWGNVIEIDHGEYISVYKNLSTLIMVNSGDTVKKGDPISGVGDSGAAESAMGAHLHFEILKDGKAVDPAALLDKSSLTG